MDLSVPPDSKTARLPRRLQPLAVLAHRGYMELRALVRREHAPAYVFEADGLATVHYSPFLGDREFSARYDEMASEWFVHANVDVRWRMWLLTRFAHQCRGLEGDYAEFGVYRAGCAYMMLATSGLPTTKRLFLFDTFAGFPPDMLTDSERAAGLHGALANTSVDYVAARLAPWKAQVMLVEGDVFVTLPGTETGPLAFVHMDLNLSKPTTAALEYAYPRLTAGAIVVFDDYGGTGLEAQRLVVDEFLADKTEDVIALPSGQGMMIKR
jgi:O-methyltransferase